MGIGHAKAIGIQLGKKVIDPILIIQAVWIVHKAVHGGEMSEGPGRLPIQGVLVLQRVGKLQQVNQAFVSTLQAKLQLLALIALQIQAGPAPGLRA